MAHPKINSKKQCRVKFGVALRAHRVRRGKKAGKIFLDAGIAPKTEPRGQANQSLSAE